MTASGVEEAKPDLGKLEKKAILGPLGKLSLFESRRALGDQGGDELYTEAKPRPTTITNIFNFEYFLYKMSLSYLEKVFLY